MKGNAEHSATTTKFLLENVATNHFEKKKRIRQERIEKKEKKRKRNKRKEQEERKQEKQKTWLILPVVICLSQRKKNGKRKNK